MRAILFASATAATILGLRATSAASQRFVRPPLRAPPADYAHGPDYQKAADVRLAHLADRTQPCLAAGGSLSWNHSEPRCEVSSAVKCIELRCKCRDSASRDRANSRDGAEPTHLCICLRCRLACVRQLFDHRGEPRDLVEVNRSHLPYQAGPAPSGSPVPSVPHGRTRPDAHEAR